MKEKSFIRLMGVPLGVLFLSFIGVTWFTMLYMAKDNNYNNMIYQYFRISKEFYGRLIYLDMDKEFIVNAMNLCSISFLAGNYLLFGLFGTGQKKRKGVLLFLTVFLILQAVVNYTSVQKAVYYGVFGFLPDPARFRNWYAGFHVVTVVGNIGCLIVGFVRMILLDLRKEPIQELRQIKTYIVLTDMGLCGLYFYMFYSLPDSFLWISRSTGYIAYRSLKMIRYVGGMRLIPYLIAFFLLMLCYYLYRYRKMCQRVSNEEYVFSSIVASSEISTRAFSHYVKNELLGIMTEAERAKTRQPELQELEHIQNSCQRIYERLDELQKNTNRIVLNQSIHNVVEVLEKALEENRPLLEKQGISLDWKKEAPFVGVFLDPRYLKEVFRNLLQNAVEAMEGMPGEKKIFVRTVQYERQIEIMFADSGPGLAVTVQNRLFEPFVSTKSTKHNWGIGLSFSKRIINSHHGKITAENREEGGAVFRIYLPVCRVDRQDESRI